MTTPYGTLVEAQAYFDERLGTGPWEDADDTNKLKALKQATRLINRLAFIGYRNAVAIAAENEFPRGTDTTVPVLIKEATFELALALLDGVDPNMEVSNIAAVSRSNSITKSSYDRNFVLSHVRAGIPSIEAWQRLVPYIVDPLTITLKR